MLSNFHNKKGYLIFYNKKGWFDIQYSIAFSTRLNCQIGICVPRSTWFSPPTNSSRMDRLAEVFIITNTITITITITINHLSPTPWQIARKLSTSLRTRVSSSLRLLKAKSVITAAHRRSFWKIQKHQKSNWKNLLLKIALLCWKIGNHLW